MSPPTAEPSSTPVHDGVSVPWGVHTLAQIYSPNVEVGLPDGRWARAVSEPYTGNRLRAAWWVLTGKAFALRWPEGGELEDALGTEPPSYGQSSKVNADGGKTPGDNQEPV